MLALTTTLSIVLAVLVVVLGWHLWRRTREEPDPPRRVWVQNVNVAARFLESRLKAARARRAAHTKVDPGAAELDRCVEGFIRSARSAATRRDPVPGRLANWWRGTLIEAAYQNLHAAEALIVNLYDKDEVAAEIPEAVARVNAGLSRDDERVVAALELQHALTDGRPLARTRAQLQKAIDVGHAAADQTHTRLRGFRNTVLVSAALITLLVVSFVWYVYAHPSDVPLCFTPPHEEGLPASWVCPTTELTPVPEGGGPNSPGDVIVVALLGLLGGAFSAAVAIKNLTGTSTPYDVPVALAGLKLPLGALTAIGGLIAIQGDFIPGLSELDSQAQVLAYSLVFGYAQQLFTGLIDRRAETLLSSAPGKDSTVARAEVQITSGPPGPPSPPASPPGEAQVAKTQASTDG